VAWANEAMCTASAGLYQLDRVKCVLLLMWHWLVKPCVFVGCDMALIQWCHVSRWDPLVSNFIPCGAHMGEVDQSCAAMW
jgi:hypothetical protein